MSNWKRYIFDHEGAQRDDIDSLLANAEIDDENFDRLRRQLQATEARLDRAELVIETLFMLLENQGLVKPETFEVMLRQVDELDGEVDGRAGVKPSQES